MGDAVDRGRRTSDRRRGSASAPSTSISATCTSWSVTTVFGERLRPDRHPRRDRYALAKLVVAP